MFKKIIFLALALAAPMALFAQEAAAAAPAAGFLKEFGLALGAALAIGFAAAGGGIGQGKVGAAALEGIARNPGSADKIFTPMIIGLALIESLVIYALLIAFMLLNKIG